MRQFRWLGDATIPRELDLRLLGWSLAASTDPAIGCPALLHRRDAGPGPILSLPAPPGLVLLIGIADPYERARLLRLGVGDVIGAEVALGEVEARARRLARQADWMPRRIELDALTLDLLARDGFVSGRPLGLFPREFELLWRLAEAGGRAQTPRALLTDVWRLAHQPETNSLAVHVSRLRAKLRIAGLDGLVETTRDGAYRLARRELPLDAPLRFVDNGAKTSEESPACATNSSLTTAFR